MKPSAQPPTTEELIGLLPTPGWNLVTSQTLHMKNRSLEEAVRAAHARHVNGEEPGLISRMENALELDMLQLQELWMHLGLPT